MIPYGNVFQGNLGQQPQDVRRSSDYPTAPPRPGRVMDGPGTGFGPIRPTGYAQPIQEPSQGTPYGMPRKPDDSGFYPGGPRMADETGFNYQNPRQPPQWNMGDDIRRPPSNPVRPPVPPAQPPGRIMDGPGSGFTFPRQPEDRQYAGGTPGFDERTGRYSQGFGDDIRRAPSSSGKAQPIPSNTDTNWQPDPEEYRRSIAAERARAAKMDAEAAAKRQKMLQDRQTYEVPGYSGRVTDPMVAQNEYDRLAREQKAAARGDKPRKTQMELDMEAQQQEHNRILQQRDQAQKSLPGVDEATQRAVRQRMSAYGETPEEAFQNGGFAAQQAYASSRMNDGPGPSARTPAGQSRWR